MNHYVLEIKSILSELEKLELFVDEIAIASSLSFKTKNKLSVLLSEATTNAIIHGNKLNEEAQVQIQCMFQPENNSLCCKITDQGTGFDHTQIKDPTAIENIEKEGGRGVFLMQQLSDEIHYENNGASVIFKFCL